MEKYDFKSIEKEILNFWEENDTYKSIKRKNHGKKKFYFLQGPPYTSGRIHLGTAWNHILKDEILRYKRMRGFDVWDRGGYDMHGLPTESKVQKKFSLETKKDIINFGLERFSNECIKFSEEGAATMSQDFWNLGIWMSNENPYMPIHESFTEGVWYLIKKVHEKNRLYKGKKSMTWCKDCETGLAKHELEYKNVTDTSIFVKFKILNSSTEAKNNLDEYLIVWTTTPWTIPYNLAIMVNPELDYIRAKVETAHGPEIWIVSTALAGVFINGVANLQFEIIEQFKGDKLLGTNYIHPFHKNIEYYANEKKHHKNIHTVVLSEEYVDTSAGTGLVHCAPGCGPEDFEVGKKYGIPPFNNIDERGVFPIEMGRFAGLVAKDNDNLFIDVLREVGALIETSYVEHDYAHCNRCHKPVVFRVTDQWFFKTEDIKEKMLKFNNEIYWYPDTAKNAFDGWLRNLKDNSITKQRFWGTPVPIWICDNQKCNKYEVIGSVAELKERSENGHLPNNLHKPWIDDVKITCDCGQSMTRIPDVLDVWIDAGSVSWNCLDFPRNNELMDKYFPADFIVEGKDQIRGWYNLLMICSTLAFDRAPFKNVSMHGFITDVEGEKMSKSLGNIISPYEIVEKYGVDTLRYYAIDITIGDDMNFSWGEVELKNKNLIILWNLHNFLIDFVMNNKISLPEDPQHGEEEYYILSRTNSTIKKITQDLELYHLDATPHLVESLFMDFSRVYIQLIREKSVSGSDEDKESILHTMFEVYFSVLKMFSIVCPFITDKIYHNLKSHKIFDLTKSSIHDYDWPEYNESLIDTKLEEDVILAQELMQAMLSARDKIGLGVRWPLKECIIDTKDENMTKATNRLKDMILRQTNIKDLRFGSMNMDFNVKPNFKALGKSFGIKTSDVVSIITEHSHSIAENLASGHNVILGGFEITPEHVNIERKCSDDFVMVEIRGGFIYVDKKLYPELELEGFTREVTRRIQQLRKTAGLNKRDSIQLVVNGEVDISEFRELLSEKVGAKSLKINEYIELHDAVKSDEVIKGKKFQISFKKI